MEQKVLSNGIKSWPKDDRPREKLLKHGEHKLSNSELLAILLRTGIRGESAIDLARKILAKFKTFRNMSHTDIRDWKELKGLGVAKIAQLKSAIEIGKRMGAEKYGSASPLVTYTEDIVNLFESRLRDLKCEVFKVVLCDSRNKIIDDIEITQGTPTESYPIIRNIISITLQKFATGIICLHNHPNGESMPSKDDIIFTKALKDACTLLSIGFLDHIIFGESSYYSFDKQISCEYADIC